MNSGDISRKIAALRKKRGMKLIELAERAGLSQGHMSRLEAGKQGFRSATLLRIAEALGVKPVYFFIDEEGEGAQGTTQPYGLLAGGRLPDALRSVEFVELAERLADAYLQDGEAFAAMRVVADIVLGERRRASRGGRKAPRPRRATLSASRSL